MVYPNSNLNYLTVVEIPGDHIINREFSNGLLIYLGHAAQGTSNSTAIWKVRKYTYTNNQCTSERMALGIAWEDRASATYA